MKINFFPCTSSYVKDEGGKSRKDKKYMVKIPLIFILSKKCFQFERTRQTVQDISYFHYNPTLQLGKMVNILSLEKKK